MKIFAKNKKAYHNYFILDKMEAGIALVGTEVKSIRQNKVNFADSFAVVENGEVFLKNLDIQPYEQATFFNHNPKRKRKLLLHRHEIGRLISALEEKALTLVPIIIYGNDKGKVKVELGIGKRKNAADKRRDIDKKESQRTVRRIMKSMG